MRREEITCPGSRINPTNKVSRILGGTSKSLLVYLLIGKFSPPWGKVSHFPCKWVIRHSQFFQVFLKMRQKASGVFGVLIPLFFTSLLHLHSNVLHLSAGTRTRTFITEKCCHSMPWHGPFTTHSLFFLSCLHSRLLHSFNGCSCLRHDTPS